MEKTYIYCISITKFNEKNEIMMDYVSNACYSSLKKACKELSSSLKVSVYTNKSVENADTLSMLVRYNDEKGVRTLESIERKLLY